MGINIHTWRHFIKLQTKKRYLMLKIFDVLMFNHMPLCHQQNKGLTPIKFLFNYKALNKSYNNVTINWIKLNLLK